ncbi:adenylate/guanylate cyclase domain-containing protein [Streptomyces sp. WAC06614]|uniref:adenylate/guanylate cyclase domain-containing protein n=1 Tax=Streptomyces sp. WAC06614 TaxID=2487416 RepID=UPI000F770C1A|nr:adenylate/guanylate cyclase domain-containing protein [Streptomyces sp. WAC06614]RSS83579.1 adenylate/guanylate cyclase domain-containing response regulator [Streptomyces sp. WAC06614]
MAGKAVVLVADDDAVTRILLSRLVEQEGNEVVTAATGREACDLLASVPVDIVLLDIEMPDLDGFDVLRFVRNNPNTNDLPVVMVSALEDLENVVRAIEMGADDYLSKPVNRTLLRARLNSSLNRKRLKDLEHRRVRDRFARFVPEPVVDEMLADLDAGLRLGGERRFVTVMFSDLRGFTSWAETRPPDLVIEVLNRYLGAMSDVILDHGGTLVSYLGDGIMAVFGAPLEQSDHAESAARAARAMVMTALSGFNAWLSDRGVGGPFRMGIGLNSGPVMSGTVGSERRLEYAAVGDTTNTASRLEQLTKELGHSILLADSTRRLLPDDVYGLIPVGAVALRGRIEPVEVFALGSS